MGGDFQVKIMGGAGLTSNLDRPNMPGGNCLNFLKGNLSSVRGSEWSLFSLQRRPSQCQFVLIGADRLRGRERQKKRGQH